jgi:ABC-type multidrug transport system fused ATPase/permease subunit
MEVAVTIALIVSGASYSAISVPFAILTLYLVQKYYLRTSRQIRLLDLELKTPLYTQFSETLAGLSTIRAFGWSDDLLVDNYRLLDTSQRPFYTLFCIQRWLNVVLDLFAAGMAVLLVSIALFVPSSTSQGAVGVSLVTLIQFNVTLSLMIRYWTDLETSLGAIARLKWFVEKTSDENREGESESVSSDWPPRGEIELENVTAAYR